MIDNQTLTSLLTRKSSQDDCLSIYLKVKPGFTNLKPLHTKLKNMLKSLPDNAQKALRNELNTLTNLVKNTPPTGKDLAIFAAPGQFTPLSLSAELPADLISVGNTYTVYPLAYAQQFSPIVLFTIIQKKEVQLLRIDSDVKKLLSIKRKDKEREDRMGFFTRGGRFRSGFSGDEQNKEQEQTLSFIKECGRKISERIDVELSKLNAPHIEIISGDPKFTEVFAKNRPQTCQPHISLLDTIFGYTQEKRIKMLSRQIVRSEHKKKLAEVVKSATASGSKGGAVSATHALTALQEGRVNILVLSINTPIPGTVCKECEYIIAATAQGCPVCSGKTAKKDDITEAIYRKGKKMAEAVLLTAKPLPIHTPVLATFRY